MAEGLREAIAASVPDLTVARHHLHSQPEVSGHEEQTARFVAERLRLLGYEPRERVGGHGVVADLEGGAPGRRLALHADMDALPIEEESDLPYASKCPGAMHACGHDGHTTVLLGAARILAARRGELVGSVRFVFQPAEETVSGARRMCEDGAMEGVDAIVALHGWPELALGRIGVRDGAMMAAADTFDILVRGRQAHAAYPAASVDPVVAGSHLVLALQSLVSREVDPHEPVVVTVAQFHAGTAYNIIPAAARLAGTVRTLGEETRAAMPGRIRRIARATCAAARATCRVSYTWGTPPVLNDPGVNALVRLAGREALGEEGVVETERPSMGAEDFAFYLQHAPGAMFRLGLGDTAPIHTPTFDFDDRALAVGVELFCRIARTYLRPASGTA